MRYYRNYGAKNINLAPIDDLVKVLPTREQTGKTITFDSPFIGLPLKSCKIALTATQSGSGTPSPDNVRPISGADSIHIQNTAGINQWCEIAELGTMDTTTGKNTPNASRIRSTNYILVNPNTTYYINMPFANNEYILWYEYDSNKNFIRYLYKSNGTTVTTTSDTRFVRFSTVDYGTTYNHDISINYPSTDTDYHAFVGQSITVQIGSTVYGGEYDARTGVFTVTHGYIEFDGSENWINVGGLYPQAFQIDTGITNAFQGVLTTQARYNITNWYPWTIDEVTNYGIRWQLNVQSGRLYVYDNNYTSDLAGFTQHLSDTHLQVVFLLTTPTTIQLPPCPIDTLLGENNIWADTGDTTAEYYTLERRIL